MESGMKGRRLDRLKRVSASRQSDLAVVLENVHDMHNIGAVLRSCDATGIQSVYILVNDPEQELKNMTIGKRTSSGARKWVDVYAYRDTKKCLTVLRSRYDRILGAGMEEAYPPHSLYSLDLTTSAALVFGNEHTGLSQEMIRAVDGQFSIPQIGMTRSLNVSVACAVTLYESLRQRLAADLISERFDPTDEGRIARLEDFKRRHHEGHVGNKPIWPEEE